jgi:murein DD-endopeptidase MepM/ murein hydrolase activator NlpD
MRFELIPWLIAGMVGLTACSTSEGPIAGAEAEVDLTKLVGHHVEADDAPAAADKVDPPLEERVRVADEIVPGGMIVGRAPADSEVRVDGKIVRLTGDGRFVFGVGRDAEGEVELAVEGSDNQRITRRIAIAKRDYQIQRIDGLPPRKVEPNKDDQAKIEADWIVLNKAKGANRALDAFAEEAVWPVIGPISGVFGSQRILNGKPRSPHRGVDVAAPKGTPVGTMLNGVVTVASPDMYYTGGTVMVDHGHGIQSLYAHLSKIDVEVGQELAKGDQVGLIGSTGRSTGPHLHLSLYWFETALDPALVLGPMPKIEAAGSQNDTNPSGN